MLPFMNSQLSKFWSLTSLAVLLEATHTPQTNPVGESLRLEPCLGPWLTSDRPVNV